jgi:pimeloyl-ACP methyl ester carboxylesterase
MKSHRVMGGGGAQLHLVEAGNPGGRPIVFFHGFSQCWRAWSRQLSSDLADDWKGGRPHRSYIVRGRPHDSERRILWLGSFLLLRGCLRSAGPLG